MHEAALAFHGTTVVRAAEVADIPRLLEMGSNFIRGTRYRELIQENPEQLKKLLAYVMAQGEVLVLENETGIFGMLGLVLFDHPMSGQRFASEYFWWVEPDQRGLGALLLEQAERIARERGAVALQMIAPNERVGRLYERIGYQKIESTYQRNLA